MKHLYLISILWASVLFGQNDDFEKQLDSLFTTSFNNNEPGVAAGLIKDGKVIYLKGFGVADIETKEQITTQTKFQVDDLAKQFTVLGILLLEDQGKLSFEDDIRRFLPELQEYKTPIRIKHLLNHSSGLFTLDPIKELMGIRNNDVFTQEDALKIIRAQKELNFTPGTAFSYHTADTEIILMVEIIAKASGKSFIEYTKEQIFDPLGMANTTFNSDRKILPHLAKSYTITEDVFYNPINDMTLGVTNLYTTAEDLSIWFQAFYKSDQLSKVVQKLDNYVTLVSGKEFASTWGKLTLGRYFDHPERGLDKMSWQFGLKGGYGSNMFRFQSHNVIAFVLGNNNQYNGMPAMLSANQILENEYTEPETIDYSKIKFRSLSSKVLKTYEGTYWDKTNGVVRELYVKNDTLRYKRLSNNSESALLPRTTNRFQLYVEGDTEVFITIYNNHYLVSSLGSDPERYDKIDASQNKLSSINLEDYLGVYYNEALDINYSFSIKENLLVTNNFKTGTTLFYPIIKDVFRSNTYMLSGIHFKRNHKGEVISFKIDTDGVKNLSFKKITLF